jgi:hypothetical protein
MMPKPKPIPIDELTRQTRAKVQETHSKLEMTESEIADATASIARSQQAIESSTRLLVSGWPTSDTRPEAQTEPVPRTRRHIAGLRAG